MITTLSRSELSKKYGIGKNVWHRRHDELLEYLGEYMEIKENTDLRGRYSYDIEGELPQSIPPLPRASKKDMKMKDYKEYTIGALGEEFKPNSGSKIARDAIRDFSREKYGHTNVAAVSARFVGPAMKEVGQRSEKRVWADYYTYEPLSAEQVEDLRIFFAEEKMSEKEMANAFILERQGEDISQEISRFERVMDKFKEKYQMMPIYIYEWKLCGKLRAE